MLLYIDFGNKEKVGKDVIRRFDLVLFKYFYQSVYCKMVFVIKFMEILDLLKVFVSLYNQLVQIKLKGFNNIDLVEVEVVMEDGSSVNQIIVELFFDEVILVVSFINQVVVFVISLVVFLLGIVVIFSVIIGFIFIVSRLQFQKVVVFLDGSQLQCLIIEFISLNFFYL